ncbi:MAG: hypothetical protein NZ937_04640, partial [Armatimonadetes bacterium]|nr:hypothetical protein [Armatimonadota bacterium]
MKVSQKGLRLMRKMLQKHIDELVELAKTIAPDAEISVLEPYEDEDAVIEVRVSPDKVDEVDEVLLRRSTQIWLESG